MVLPCAHNSVVGGGGSDWLVPTEPRGRSNSIPPAQTPTAKHMLAYLPRPPTDTSQYGTFPQEVWLVPGLSASLGQDATGQVGLAEGISHQRAPFCPAA